MFSEQNPEIGKALDDNNGFLAFELMHQVLDKVWDEVYRVLKPGGISCINIGDATRTINNNFQLFSSSSRIIHHCLQKGFSCLPKILWKKTTNAPNKFMGSGMMPPGAYVTLEHEYILILRKGAKRDFNTDIDKTNRRESSYFWEERNTWFTDIWEGLNGVSQKLDDKNIRERSAAFPFELAYRLINMFSLKGDTVLDPFLGTGTTTLAAMASGRNSIGYEIDPFFENIIKNRIGSIVETSNKIIEKRLNKHAQFVEERETMKGPLKYLNYIYDFKVMTRQETGIYLNPLKSICAVAENEYEISYHERKDNSAAALKEINESGLRVSTRETENKEKLTVLTSFI